MQRADRVVDAETASAAGKLPVSVIVAARNEARNLPQCLASLRDVGEVYVVDSQSIDETVEIARSYGSKVVQFHYQGGWPKKRQWAMDSLPLAFDWVLLLDADECLTPELIDEIREAIANPEINGHYIALRMHFLGRVLRHCAAGFWKLSLFRRDRGHFECRLAAQDVSMADMEVHEHIIVEGKTARLRNPIIHRNVDSLSRYIQKHNEYSNWEARVWLDGEGGPQLQSKLFGNQAQRRRWLKERCLKFPGSPALMFLYKYFLALGFLDGVPGLIYCGFQAVQVFHIKSKMAELRMSRKGEQ